MLIINTRRLGHVTILCLQGRIVVGEINSLRLAFHVESNVDLVVFNLAQVSVIDASGLGLFVELHQWSRERGIELRLMELGARVRQIIEISCLNTVFEISSRAEILSLAGSREALCDDALLSCGAPCRSNYAVHTGRAF
jgi:anti-anti-sigma factor